jgi:myosin heavy subunit
MVKVEEICKELKGDNKELKEDNKELKKSNEELKHGQETLKVDNKELKKSNEELKHGQETLKVDNKELKKSNEELKHGQETLKVDNKELKNRLRDHDEQAQLRALVEMDLRCNNIRKSLLAFPDGRFKSMNGGPKINPETRQERNINTHALLLSPCLSVCSMEAAEPRHSNLFEAYFGISAEEAESWSTHEFEDIEVRQVFQKHSLLITNGVARHSLEPFKAFKRAMRELVRLADKKMDISNARAEAVRCAREAIATARADEEIARSLSLFAYATREKWSIKSKVRAKEENPYNWPAIIGYWQDEGLWGHIANHTNVTETGSS